MKSGVHSSLVAQNTVSHSGSLGADPLRLTVQGMAKCDAERAGKTSSLKRLPAFSEPSVHPAWVATAAWVAAMVRAVRVASVAWAAWPAAT